MKNLSLISSLFILFCAFYYLPSKTNNTAPQYQEKLIDEHVFTVSKPANSYSQAAKEFFDNQALFHKKLALLKCSDERKTTDFSLQQAAGEYIYQARSYCKTSL